MRKWLQFLCAVCLCTLLLSGCGNASNPNSPAASPGVTQGTEPAVSPQGDVGPPDKTQAPTPYPQDSNPQGTASPAQ